jgi:hypothetical protein
MPPSEQMQRSPGNGMGPKEGAVGQFLSDWLSRPDKNGLHR